MFPNARYHQAAFLPYSCENGVGSFMSAPSLDFLYNMRQVELINNVNRLTEGSVHEANSLYRVIFDAAQDTTQTALLNNASQAWNIDFFLQTLTVDPVSLREDVRRQIAEQFVSFDRFKATFAQSALSIFGNGWTWLVMNETGQLSVMNTYNAGCPFTAVPSKESNTMRGTSYSAIQRSAGRRPFIRLSPIIGLSMWQESYLPDYGLDRETYVSRFWDVVNWNVVHERMLSSRSGLRTTERRTTMNIGEGSGIPQPSMIRGPRASMAPSMFGQAAPGSVLQPAYKAELAVAQTPARGPRGLFGGNPPQSNLRNNTVARFAVQTPGTNRVNRRVSVFASTRRTTLGVPGTATRGGGPKDPRPVKERGFQAKAQQRIMNFLSTRAYPGMLTPKTLAMPTVKDFQTIFRFLYAQLDGRYVYQGKFEDDVLAILRGIHYPYVGNISKSHIYSAGSMSTWPGLLAMLLWLVELIECVGLMNQTNDVSELKDSALFVDRVFFDYLSLAYP
ncbi:hypothetical protein GGI06_001111, partial [Coemansia sp. S85]